MTILVIAGSNSSGGAGIQRDAQVAAELGIVARFAVTAITAQSDRDVGTIWPVPASVVRDQLEMALNDRQTAAIKIGMLCNGAIITAIAGCLRDSRIPIVMDPVLQASSGAWLVDEAAVDGLRRELLPLASLVTPNRLEAALLTVTPVAGSDADAVQQARLLGVAGAGAVLMKGGHAKGNQAVDLLVQRGHATQRLAADRLPQSMRGTGCALSTAIAIHLARGCELGEACRRAKDHVHRLIAGASVSPI